VRRKAIGKRNSPNGKRLFADIHIFIAPEGIRCIPILSTKLEYARRSSYIQCPPPKLNVGRTIFVLLPVNGGEIEGVAVPGRRGKGIKRGSRGLKPVSRLVALVAPGPGVVAIREAGKIFRQLA
jgi:hypothetical protein